MSHRREEKERLRQERLERERAAKEAQRRKKLVAIVAAVVLGIVALGGLGFAVLGGGDDDGDVQGGDSSYYPDGSVPDRQVEDLDEAARAAGCELEDPRNEGSDHVEGEVEYDTNPPTGGDHNPVPADDGIYGAEAPAKENYVHTLEHGRIIVQFKPTLPAEQRGRLRALVEEDSYHMVLMPNNTDMPYDVAAIAWDHKVVCPRMGDKVFDAIRAFKEQYRDQGPEQVP
jgi:hypothetical protein